MEKTLLYDSMPQLLVLCLRLQTKHEDLQRKVSEWQGRHRGRVCRKTLGKVAMAASGDRHEGLGGREAEERAGCREESCHRARPKGLRRYRRAVMSNKDTITKLAKSVGVPDNKIATVDQILKVANNFYAKDVSGGLIALAELTGHPLSEEEEQTIEREWRQARRSTTPVYSLFSKRKRPRRGGRDLYQDSKDSFWGRHGFYVAISAVALTLIAGCSCCVLCYRLCLRKKGDNLRQAHRA
ncbi:hypothetical protein Q5P01_000909 [Channa striata]|uniref:Uncharacterized protein n=1 Tax=Channa striata TaxID=64152 RepID=A0AA88IHR0_CHASR|nr:hypothetical protein Q5P01_000909 [Channa striata]